MSDYTELGYIGDGAYLSHDGYQFWLAANNHENKVVALEPTVLLRMIEVICTEFPHIRDAITTTVNQTKERPDED